MIQQDISVATGQVLTEIDGDQRLSLIIPANAWSSEKVEKDIADHRHWLDQYTKVQCLNAESSAQRLMEQ